MKLTVLIMATIIIAVFLEFVMILQLCGTKVMMIESIIIQTWVQLHLPGCRDLEDPFKTDYLLVELSA